MRSIRIKLLCLPLLYVTGLALTLAACSGGPAATVKQSSGPPVAQPALADYPLTVENCGQELTFDQPPQRIVTLEQTLTEISLALGVEDRMVGTSYVTDPILPELKAAYDSVPVLAELYPTQEVVLETEPDFIYAYGPTSVSAENAGTPESYANLGIPVYVLPVSCLDDSLSVPTIAFDGFFDEIRTLASIYGVPEAGQELIAEQRERIDAALGKHQPPPDGTSFVWWFAGTDTPYFGTETSDAGNYASLLGMENAFADGGPGRWAGTSWEVIADRDPDVIVLADLTRGNDGDSAKSKIEYLKSNPATAQLTAVVEDQFIVVPGSARGYSIRTVESLERIVDGLREIYGER